MKIRSLLLGSVAAAGLSTGAYAADLGVLTSLDVCDALGLSGLTISSDTNCLQITGSVSYEFKWGDYRGEGWVVSSDGGYGRLSIIDNDMYATGNRDQDWYSKVEAWIKFVATADSDFGPAKAVIKIKDLKEYQTRNENNLGPNNVANPVPASWKKVHDNGTPLNNADDVYVFWGGNGVFETTGTVAPGGDDVFVQNGVATLTGTNAFDDDASTGGDHLASPIFDEAYVSIGDTTVIMAGKKGTIANFGDDTPLTFLNLFQSEKVDSGVKWTKDLIKDGGHVIQVTSDLGNGVSVKGSLEQLDAAGNAFGVIEYAGDGISAHFTGAAAGILDGVVNAWGIHAGVSGTFDMATFRAAFAWDSTNYWNALATAAVTFDMFTLAGAVEATTNSWGAGASVGAAVTDGVTINLGGRYYSSTTMGGHQAWQVAAQVAAAVTETITLTGEVGAYGTNLATPAGDPYITMGNAFYGSAQVAWAPGGGFTSSLKGEVNSLGAYRATFKAAKTFE